MTSRVILLHGLNTDPSDKWYPWLAQEMEQRGIEFAAPALPAPTDPNIAAWTAELDKLHPDENTILIGHSRGGVAVLRWLEAQPASLKVKKIILIATNSGFEHKRAIKTESNHGFYTEQGYDFKKIKQHCNDFVILHSKDDQWVPYDAGVENTKGLDARLVSFDNKGHFGKGVDNIPELIAEIVDFAQIGQDSLKAYVQTIQELIEQDEQFDVIAAAGDSRALLATRITEEVYKALGKSVPPKLVAPIYRHADEAETILFDNSILASQFENWKTKPLKRVLFVDDEIGSGNAARGMLDLLLELNPDIQSYTIVAEDGGFDCPPEIHGVKASFIPTRQRIPNSYNAISHTIPWKLQKPLKEVFWQTNQT